jgi:hypothetical protein
MKCFQPKSMDLHRADFGFYIKRALTIVVKTDFHAILSLRTKCHIFKMESFNQTKSFAST